MAAAGADAPVLQLGERDRYSPGDGSVARTSASPALMVDIDRRVDPALLSACFTT